MNIIKLRQLLQNAFLEDLGEGDISSQTIFSSADTAEGTFTAKEPGIICGLKVMHEAYHMLDETIKIEFTQKDGDIVDEGTVIGHASGPVASLLSGERLVLNLMQRMSGIATLTYHAIKALDSDHTRICDTRKTLPGLRMLEKYAVRCGGGFNHRLGLYDGVMLKDNHITHAGSITKAVEKAKANIGHMVKIEVETESAEQVREAVKAGADIIMFDNQSPDEVKDLVALVPEHITTEVSGGITLETLPGYRDTGVDYISLGMLTHSPRALDISFNLKGGNK